MSTSSPSVRIFEDEFLGHPKGLYICFFTEMWERFSFYGMKALLFLYLTKYHLFGDAPSYDLLGAYGALVYAMPVLGGLLADRYLGMRKAVVLGGVLLCLGHFGMAFEGVEARVVGAVVQRDTAALAVFYLSLALIIAGVGFLKPNISTIVGKLYPERDPRRDSGFTIFYAGINIGALFASLICGYLGETFGWRYGFGAAGVGMVVGLIVFIWGQRYLHGHAESRHPERLARRVAPGLSIERLIYAGALLGVLVIWQLLQQLAVWQDSLAAIAEARQWDSHLLSVNVLFVLASFAAFLSWFLWFCLRRCTREQRQQMFALMILIFAGLAFFTLYEQTYGSWVAFTDRLLGKDLFPALVLTSGGLPWGIWPILLSPLLMVYALTRPSQSKAGIWAMAVFAALTLVAALRDVVLLPQTAGSLTFLGAFFVVALAPIFTWLWPALARRGWEPSVATKSALGLVFAGLSFLPLIAAAKFAGDSGVLASVWWLVLAYLILEVGELCLSPVGLSAVTKLSVPSVVSVMMGAWFLGTACSEALAAFFGKFAALDIAPGESLDVAAAAATYGGLFQTMCWLGLGCALLLFLCVPLIKRWTGKLA